MFDISNLNNLMFFLMQPENETDKGIDTRFKWLSIWYGVLSNIMMGIFTYENIPVQLKRRINRSFFTSSYVCAYLDDKVGVAVAPCSPCGNINNWGEYSAYDLILPDGKGKRVNLDDVVIGYNYDLPTVCDSVLCHQFAQQIAELKISIENAIILSRNTAIFEVPNENALNEALTQFNSHRNGNPVIVKKRREEDEYKTMEFTAPTKVDEYYNGLRDVLNEFLTTTGLSSLVNPNKKERLITDEISSNDDIKNTLLSNRIDNRVAFINGINEKFDTDYNVSVDDNIFKTINDLVERGGDNVREQSNADD